MNVVATNGSVHMAAGAKRTKCSARIRSQWQSTDAPLTCWRCQQAATAQPTIKSDVAAMLSKLDCHIADELLVIQVLPDVSGATVIVRKAEIAAWCEKRLEARKAFANKCIRGGSGAPVLGTIRLAR
jgi:hypothetical protein